jgi:hypothetical protein
MGNGIDKLVYFPFVIGEQDRRIRKIELVPGFIVVN